MIELAIGFIVGVIIGFIYLFFCRVSVLLQYEEEIEELQNKVFQLKRNNAVLQADNERLKDAFVWKVDK